MIDYTETEATSKDEPPEDNTINTDDTSKDDTSEVDMSTDCSSRKWDSDPKQTHQTHSCEEVVAHVNKMNGTFYGSALLDQLESFARVGDPKLLLENSAQRKRARVPLMGVVDLTRDLKGDTATSSGTSSNEGKKNVVENVSTSEEKMCKEPSDWRSEGPGCFKPYLCSSNCPEAEVKTLMVIRAKRSGPRRKVAREVALLQDLQKEDKLSPKTELTRRSQV